MLFLVKALFFEVIQRPRQVRAGSGSHCGSHSTSAALRHPGGSYALLAFDEMPVHVFRNRDARVSENFGDHVEVGALGQHQRRP